MCFRTIFRFRCEKNLVFAQIWYISACVCMSACVHVCMCACECEHGFVHTIILQTHKVNLHMYTYIYVYVYIYIYIRTYEQKIFIRKEITFIIGSVDIQYINSFYTFNENSQLQRDMFPVSVCRLHSKHAYVCVCVCVCVYFESFRILITVSLC
jgi:hypothetical protein